ncbi:hypothetical protein SUGI_0069600 [Cryptomeria japonica]|nr:hypothetical protein SUGI_0069600 [Cryptomeria japonica]
MRRWEAVVGWKLLEQYVCEKEGGTEELGGAGREEGDEQWPLQPKWELADFWVVRFKRPLGNGDFFFLRFVGVSFGVRCSFLARVLTLWSELMLPARENLSYLETRFGIKNKGNSWTLLVVHSERNADFVDPLKTQL